MNGAGEPAMLDLAFELQGRVLPRAHRAALAAALTAALPWLAEEPDAAVHRLNVAAGGGPTALLSGRTRLTLRLPRHRTAAVGALCGRTLNVAGQTLTLGALHERELLPVATQYAHCVAAAEGPAAAGDEAAFLQQVQQELHALGIGGRAICGRHHRVEDGRVAGYGLMLDGLRREEALRLLQAGLGAHRLWGCGVFVPHKSAAAVGAID